MASGIAGTAAVLVAVVCGTAAFELPQQLAHAWLLI